jgi:hypothetical protein
MIHSNDRLSVRVNKSSINPYRYLCPFKRENKENRKQRENVGNKNEYRSDKYYIDGYEIECEDETYKSKLSLESPLSEAAEE